ncbi:hypothetical protein QAD02_001266 [Eretmocerus hayati]|uniref:Uncharacterized protein n=1 Tax=Eretmocerus hayati TaxID=131215 RepID=A0ACC2NFS5_9HYME|nr:hypothetical protein QAD02_001266 [Eretmocerus hayati]
MLVWLGKLSKIFDRGHDFHDMSKLKNDPIAISIGAFLLKLNIMALDRAVTLRLVVPTEFDAYFRKCETSEERLYCSTLNLSTIMAVRGCIPNTIFNYTRELLCIWHSIQPIKEGDKTLELIFEANGNLERCIAGLGGIFLATAATIKQITNRLLRKQV